MMAFEPLNSKASDAPRVAYVIDPRFSGGTSSAVAQELRAISDQVRPTIYGIASDMFSGDTLAPQIDQVIGELGLKFLWNPAQISADIVVLHNPAFLKFQTELPVKIVAQKLFVVTHENFLRPGGANGFDVGKCLAQIDRAVLALKKNLAPVSPYNRQTIMKWLDGQSQFANWALTAKDWFNICDFETLPPTSKPRDRRGRLSRSGAEKFPGLTDLENCFSAAADNNILLGADCLLDTASEHPHWQIVPFKGMEVSDFFEQIDFMVYSTSPSWRESFGRVVAESIAAGKLVISDADIAANFGDAVIVSDPKSVDQTIAGFLADPAKYSQQVLLAQSLLKNFTTAKFVAYFRHTVLAVGEVKHDTA